MKHHLKRAANAVGAHVYSDGSLPTGVSWLHDIRRAGLLGARPLCFDVGANVGQTVFEIRRVLPGAVIHAFEPFGNTYAQLSAATHALPDVTPVQLALGAATGAVKVSPRAQSELNSLLGAQAVDAAPGTAPGAHTETLRVDTIDRYCAAHKLPTIDVLKTDTEGYDLQVLRGAQALLAAQRIHFVYTEVSFLETNRQNTPFKPVFELLTAHGYCFLGLYETYSMHHFEEPNVFCNALFVSRRARSQVLAATPSAALSSTRSATGGASL